MSGKNQGHARPELLLLGQGKSRGEEGRLKDLKYTDSWLKRSPSPSDPYFPNFINELNCLEWRFLFQLLLLFVIVSPPLWVRVEEWALVPCLTHSIVVAAIPIVVACFSYVESKVFLILLKVSNTLSLIHLIVIYLRLSFLPSFF